MAPTKITDHDARAKANLIQVFKTLPNWEKFLDVFSAQVQEIEDMLFELILLRFLDDAVGEQLDGLGQIVGQPRGGRDDISYRIRLRAQIKINLSSGTIEDILEIIPLLAPNALILTELFPASFKIVFTDTLVEDPVDIALVVRAARAGGIGASIQFTLADDADTFTFASGDAFEASTAQGYSNDTGTSGGVYAEAEGA